MAGFGTKIRCKVPVWIDIPKHDGLETVVPGGLAASGVMPILPLSACRTRPFKKIQEYPMKVRNSLKSLRSRHRDNRIVRRKGRVYVINKTQPRFKARQG